MTTSTYRPYSSFTDPYLKIYFQDEQRLKQLRNFGLITKDNEVYPETVYQENIAIAERRENAAALKSQYMARDELYQQHIKLHKKWSEQEKQQKQRRIQSAKEARESRVTSGIRLPDFTRWTRKDFIKNGFEYYPDNCRPQTATMTEWHRLGRKDSKTGSSIFDRNPYLDWPPQRSKKTNKTRAIGTSPFPLSASTKSSQTQSLCDMQSPSSDNNEIFPIFNPSIPLDLLENKF
ncbi:unnamed protein product [Rotaria socialis]|uniref:Uncharacterized protein n=1 Tax=Rotaria socialis TaxID=392032 RepID=A0A818M5Z9_9BILA|nr:unnamed protein product [Rotaria socialis]CAF4594738.1 unnamed protein product [Rotaria socialis]